MSTLKKIFALTLALVMVMTVGVFADFADKSTIDAKCAQDVNTLTAIGIINGFKEDNTFRPTATITRAQACKMIYVLRNGGVDDQAVLWKGAASFTDVKAESWYSGYVGYCAAFDIVAGRSATVFDPEAPVTGVELAKMLLVVAGYKADAQGYTGTAWATNVRKDAESAGLFTNYGVSLAGPAYRQWAAKMFVNTLHAAVPTYYGDLLVTNYGGPSVAQKYLNYATEIAVVLANENKAVGDNGKANKGKTEFLTSDGYYFTGNYVAADEFVGKQVVIAYNTVDDTIYGLSETGKTVFGDLEITKSSDSTPKYTVKVGGKTIVDAKTSTNAFDDTYAFYRDEKGDKKTIPEETKTVANLQRLYANKGAEDKIVAYDFDGNGKIDVIAITPTYYDIVATATDKDGKTVLTDPDLGTITDKTVSFKANDVVKLTIDAFTGKKTLAKVENLTVAMATGLKGGKYSVSTGETLTAYAGEFNKLSDGTIELTLGKTYNIYTDGKKVIYTSEYVKGTETPTASTSITDKFAKVLAIAQVVSDEFSTEVDTIKVKALLSNGTTAIMVYDGAAKADKYVTWDNVETDEIYAYEVTADGKLVFKKAPATVTGVEFKLDGTETGTVDYANGIIGNYVADANLYVFTSYVEKNQKIEKVMKLADFKSGINGKDFKLLAYGTKENAINKVYIAQYDTTGALPGTTTTPTAPVTTLALVNGGSYEQRYNTESKKTETFYSAVSVATGATVEYKVDNAFEVPDKGIYNVTTDSNGTVTFTPATDWTLKTVKAVDPSAILFSDDATLVTAATFKDAKFYIRTSATAIAASNYSAITIAKDQANNFYYHTNTETGKIDIVIFTNTAKKNVTTW